MMYLNTQAGMAKTVNSGYGSPTTAGIPNQPPSQWVTPTMTENAAQGPYPYNPAKAEALLAAHGWKKVGGVLTCESSACGAGVKKGTQAKFAMLYTSGITTQAGQGSVLKSGFALAGLHLPAQPGTFNHLLTFPPPAQASRSPSTR